MKKILILHGPNLNLLGVREPDTYGTTSLATLDSQLEQFASHAKVDLAAIQSNHEGELVDAIQQAQRNQVDFFIINPAALTHTSIAMRDALLAVDIPFIEVHISNLYAREPFRHKSYFSDIAQGTISGLGVRGYLLALQTIIEQFNQREP